jgi:hypothetical protein
LGSSKRVWEDGGKVDEERRVESVLFGKPYARSSKGRTGAESGGEDGDMPGAGVEFSGKEFTHLINLIGSEVRHEHEHRESGIRISLKLQLFASDDGEVGPTPVVVPSGRRRSQLNAIPTATKTVSEYDFEEESKVGGCWYEANGRPVRGQDTSLTPASHALFSHPPPLST